MSSEYESEQPGSAISQDCPVSDRLVSDIAGPLQDQNFSVQGAAQTFPTPQLSRLDSIHEAIGDVAYEWDIPSDKLLMSANAQDVFDFSDAIFFSSGRGFASCQDYNNQTGRYAAVFDSGDIDQGEGVPFQIEYFIRPHGRANDFSIWVEDTGRWYAGNDGRPEKVIGVMRRSDSRYAREQAQKYLSQFDADTGLANRNVLEGELEKAFTIATASRDKFAFCLAAIDDLSVLNESYGYEVADQIIPIVASRLKSVMRSCDMIGRYAGNKFGIILGSCSEQEITVACERLVHSVCSEPVETMAGAIHVKISIGSVIGPEIVSDSKKARYAAEQALREAKSLLSECFVNYQPCPTQESERRRNIEFVDDMLTALNERRLFLTYQPIVDAYSLETVYHECLLRMTNTAGQEIDAGHFIPLSETLGLSGLIDRRVLDMAMKTLSLMPHSKLAVNISGKTVCDREWLDLLLSYLIQNPSLSSRVLIEITETAALHEVSETREFIDVLHKHGCEVAIDDFGAGYTSFKNLINLDVDLVKIDGHFVENMSQSPDNQVFVRTLIDLAKNFKMRTVAEWVTDQESVDMLRAWGVDYFQGMIFGEPQQTIHLPQLNDVGSAQQI